MGKQPQRRWERAAPFQLEPSPESSFRMSSTVISQTERRPHVTRDGLSLGGRHGLFVKKLVPKALTLWSASVSCSDF